MTSTLARQLTVVQSQVAVGQHRLLTRITEVLQERLHKDCGLVTTFGGKLLHGQKLTASLTGQKTDETGQVAKKVVDLLQDLKNPSNFVKLLKK